MRLATLANYFRTRVRPTHRALDDAEACGEVLHGLLDLGSRLGILTMGDPRRGHASPRAPQLRQDPPRRRAAPGPGRLPVPRPRRTGALRRQGQRPPRSGEVVLLRRRAEEDRAPARRGRHSVDGDRMRRRARGARRRGPPDPAARAQVQPAAARPGVAARTSCSIRARRGPVSRSRTRPSPATAVSTSGRSAARPEPGSRRKRSRRPSRSAGAPPRWVRARGSLPAPSPTWAAASRRATAAPTRSATESSSDGSPPPWPPARASSSKRSNARMARLAEPSGTRKRPRCAIVSGRCRGTVAIEDRRVARRGGAAGLLGTDGEALRFEGGALRPPAPATDHSPCPRERADELAAVRSWVAKHRPRVIGCDRVPPSRSRAAPSWPACSGGLRGSSTTGDDRRRDRRW